MLAYFDLIKTVLNNGILKHNRTGIDTISYFSYLFRHDLADGFPLLTTKKMDGKLWNSIVHELLWFISGENHIRNLKQHTKIWDAWADENGDLDSAYGYYWRHFPSVKEKMGYYKSDSSREVTNVDQLAYCIEQLKINPNNRRLVVSAWEPYNAQRSKLPACHLLYIFNVSNNRLCCHVTIRSNDLFLGFPFNLASYALLTHIIAQETNLEPGIISITSVDAHIYYVDEADTSLFMGYPKCEYDHVRPLRQQIKRIPYALPKLEIKKKPWNKITFDDISLVGYISHSGLSARVAV